MIEVKKYESIHSIEPGHWDSILDDADVFHTWRFLRIVEDGEVENSNFWYLLFYRAGELVGSTVLSAFTISLDIFVTDARWVRFLTKWKPGIFNINILICGLPASFGQLNLKVRYDGLTNEICSLIAAEMKAIAKERKISFLAVKEFLSSNLELGTRFLKEGFFLANSIPYMSLDICWNSFDEYLNALRHSYRRRVRQSLHKVECTAPVIVSEMDYDQNAPGVAWVLSRPSWMEPEVYHHLYMHVMERTKTKLETFNVDFFKELFKDDQCFQLLSLVNEGRIISSAVLAQHGDTLTFMLVGRENGKDAHDSYFNLVSGIIAYAIERRCTSLKMGQTAYWVKQSLGAVPEDQFLYFACRGAIRHALLKSLNKIIFPQMRISPVRVFKENIHAQALLSR